MDKKRLLELAGLTESDWSGQVPLPGKLLDKMRDQQSYDPQKVEELLDAAANAMAWIGYEQHPADKEAKQRLEKAYQALTGHGSWERNK